MTANEIQAERLLAALHGSSDTYIDSRANEISALKVRIQQLESEKAQQKRVIDRLRMALANASLPAKPTDADRMRVIDTLAQTEA